MFIPKDDEHFTENVKVIVSNQFISWIFSLGDGVKIVEPEDILEKVKTEVERLSKQYFEQRSICYVYSGNL